VTCDCCGKSGLTSHPKPYTDEDYYYDWVEHDEVAILQGDITPSVMLCNECHRLISDKNWQELAKRNRGSNAH
jgi:hypothetical protein